jgi:emp24/gp25L/p24 family/GOLD
MRSMKHLTCSLLVVAIVLLLVPAAIAVAQSFTVQAGQEVTKTLSLVVEDHVQIRFAVAGKTIDFYVTDPFGNRIVDRSDTGSVDYAFVCSHEGTYTLYFSNAGSAEDKLVTLDYEVTPYIFGMPQALFLVLIVGSLCVGAVAIFVLMSKHP